MSTSSAVTRSSSKLDELSINTIRFLSLDAVERANSGHPGLPLGAASMAYVLWTRFLKHNPKNPGWFDRDRFVLSAGHGSMLLYSLLHLTGYDLPLEQIEQFRQWGSTTPGHPEYGVTPGVEVTTGPLGQGFANGVGMGIAEAYLAARYNRPGYEIIDHYTYAIVGDGDLMEGVSAEAASLAGHLELGKLIYLYDNNHMSLAASTNLTFTEDVAKRFQSYGWHTQAVDDGNDLESIDQAIRTAQREKQRPSLILVHTHLGFGSPHMQDTFAAHGSPLGAEETEATKQNLGWPLEPAFYIPTEALSHFREALDRGKTAEAGWVSRFDEYVKSFPDEGSELRRLISGGLPKGWDSDIPSFPPDAKGMATRVAAARVMEAFAPNLPEFIGGSADLDPSTHTMMKGLGDFEPPKDASGDTQGSAGGGWSSGGRNIHYGVREHAMGSAMNGMAAHGGIVPLGSTFLIFSDYMRPPIRLAAIMGLHTIYVYTHDSIGLGEDGPTHQSVEQLAGLRSVPRLVVIRPADANETAVAWKVAIETRGRPVALVLSRQNVPTLDRSGLGPADDLRRGAYILSEASDGKPQLILIATGSEVSLALAAKERLANQKIGVRVVSMPSWELFEAQPQQYRDTVLPPEIHFRLSIEAASPFGWKQWVGDRGDVIGVDRFGASAPSAVVMREYGFSVDNVYQRAIALLERNGGKS